jgi:glycogen debranching enzyme
MSAQEWHACLNPEVGPSFIRQLIDLFLKYQRSDGYVTHAIYLDEKIPGSSWAKGNIIQTPHIPWVALRYYNATHDLESLEAWYPKLVKYYEYLNESRDRHFLNLHLWGIITSYETGLDTTAALQKVTYGENGAREKFCYPAIFAAERCRYEQAMGKMARILGRKDAAAWLREAGLSRQAMDRVLWDKRRNWYGILHEGRTLDTRVGVDGLFPLAYALADRPRAQLARRNFERLIGPYGIYTVAPGEPGHYEETYWRGPAWPKSCSLAMAAACHYYPELKEKVKNGLVNFVLKHPSVWECMSARTGKIARGDLGAMATPVVSSNVGAGEALGTLLIFQGRDMFSF